MNFITPSTLYSADASNNTFKVYKSLPAYFDASKYEVKQYKAKSKDGTMVPYFMVAAKDMKIDGKIQPLYMLMAALKFLNNPFTLQLLAQLG